MQSNYHIDLTTISLDEAIDVLIQDYFTKLSTIARAYGKKGKGRQLEELTEDALERRSLVNLLSGSRLENPSDPEFAGGLRDEIVSDPQQMGRSAVRRQSLRPGAGLSPSAEETSRWREWIPGVGQHVLVYLSEERGCWPGIIISQRYFDKGCLPDLPPENLYAVRIYPSKQAPTLTIKSHILPLSYRPFLPPSASPTLIRAYETAQSPEIYNTEAEALESKMRQTWGQNPERVDESRGPWGKRLRWLEEETRKGGVEDSVNMGAEEEMDEGVKVIQEREEVMARAKSILADIWKGTTPRRTIFAGTTPTLAGPHDPNARMETTGTPPPRTTTYGKLTYRRSRRNLNVALSDPLIGPILETMDLAAIHAALITPPNAGNHGTWLAVPEAVDPGPFEYVFTGGKRKRPQEGGDVSVSANPHDGSHRATDFVSPINGKSRKRGLRIEAQLREDDEMDLDASEANAPSPTGWQVYVRKKRRRSLPEARMDTEESKHDITA